MPTASLGRRLACMMARPNAFWEGSWWSPTTLTSRQVPMYGQLTSASESTRTSRSSASIATSHSGRGDASPCMAHSWIGLRSGIMSRIRSRAWWTRIPLKEGASRLRRLLMISVPNLMPLGCPWPATHFPPGELPQHSPERQIGILGHPAKSRLTWTLQITRFGGHIDYHLM